MDAGPIRVQFLVGIAIPNATELMILLRFQICSRRIRKVMILFRAVAMRYRVNINGPSYVNRERSISMRASRTRMRVPSRRRLNRKIKWENLKLIHSLFKLLRKRNRRQAALPYFLNCPKWRISLWKLSINSSKVLIGESHCRITMDLPQAVFCCQHMELRSFTCSTKILLSMCLMHNHLYSILIPQRSSLASMSGHWPGL